MWKSVVGYERLYEVSDSGDIRSVVDRKNTYKGKILKARVRSNGYRQFSLTKNGKARTYKAARLLAIAFIPNPENKPTVNHKDGVKTNDVLSNLEWATISENTKHAFVNGWLKTPTNRKLTAIGVIVIKGLLRNRYAPAKVAEIFGIHKMTVFDIKWGRTWVWV